MKYLIILAALIFNFSAIADDSTPYVTNIEVAQDVTILGGNIRASYEVMGGCTSHFGYLKAHLKSASGEWPNKVAVFKIEVSDRSPDGFDSCKSSVDVVTRVYKIKSLVKRALERVNSDVNLNEYRVQLELPKVEPRI